MLRILAPSVFALGLVCLTLRLPILFGWWDNDRLGLSAIWLHEAGVALIAVALCVCLVWVGALDRHLSIALFSWRKQIPWLYALIASPMAAVVFWSFAQWSLRAVSRAETSQQPGGLEHLFVIKALVAILVIAATLSAVIGLVRARGS